MDIQTSNLNNIPSKKILYALEETLSQCPACQEKKANLTQACQKCSIINEALQRYAAANIPVKYWKLEMKENFLGDPILLTKYNEIIQDLKVSYKNGTSLCFAGSYGIGKTMTTTNILKRAVEKGFSGLYVTLNDIISNIASLETKAESRNKLLTVDFLVIDEFDPRYMGSDNQSDLFGRILEDIIRIRTQNSLPIFICTNALDVTDSFKGSLKTSLKSLMNYITQISILGIDLRKSGK